MELRKQIPIKLGKFNQYFSKFLKAKINTKIG